MKDARRTHIRGLIILMAVVVMAMGCSAGGTALKDGTSGGLAKVTDVKVTETDGMTTVVLSMDRPVTFTSVKLSDPPMMVVDLAGVELPESSARMDVGKDPVLYVNPSRDTVSTRIARYEIGLSRPAESRISQDGSMISIIFEKQALQPEAPVSEAEAVLAAPPSVAVDEPSDTSAETSAEAAAQDMPAEAAAGVTEAPVPEALVEETVAEATLVTGVAVAKTGAGLNVVVEGDGRFSEQKVFMLGEDRLVVDIIGVESAKDKDTIQVGGGLVKRIRMASHPDPDKKVRVVLDLAGKIDYDVKPVGSDMVVAVAPRGTKAVVQVAPADGPDVKAKTTPGTAVAKDETASAGRLETKMGSGRKVTVSVAPVAKDNEENPSIYVTQKDGQTVLSSAPAAPGDAQGKVIGPGENYVVTATKIYTGGKISFDIQDADLDKVIKLLADVAGLNLIMNPGDVKGKVTLKLANVPWDQALDILLRIYNLDKVIEGNVLRVAPKKKLSEERKVDLRAIAEQKKLMAEAEDLYTKTFKVNYADASELEGKVKKILSKRGESTSNPRTNELIITDIKDKIEEAGQLIELLDKEVNQIVIEARIVTVSLGYSQSLGVSWGLTRSNGTANPSLGVTTGNEGLTTGTGGVAGTTDYQLSLPAAVTAASGASGGLLSAFSWGNVLSDVNLDLTISALETIGKAETLAAPKVMTLENKAAQITQGTTLYVQTTSASGTKPEPLNANLSLSVTPRVTGDNYIVMTVNATKNSPLSPPPGSTAAIETNAVNTNVIVKDGETVVLGGIYTKDKDRNDTEVPWFGRLPIIGWLFKQRTDADNTKELLIFITPKLVRSHQPPVRI